MEKSKIYFGHPINFYNTQKEKSLIESIHANFAGFEVVSPHEKFHQMRYQHYKNSRGDGMAYFFEEVLPQMDAGVFLAFEDGMFGRGAFREANFLNRLKKPVYEIKLEGIILPLQVDDSRMLSVEETRKRVYGH